MVRKMYHTQEKRDKKLTKPVLCKREDAWLGTGYYFWHDIVDAHMWGKKSKTATKEYEIYVADIDCENVIDTVFDEKKYFWWVEQIEFAAKELRKLRSTNKKPTLKQLNEFIRKSPNWETVAGILFQDIPESHDYSVIAPLETSSGQKYFAYKKRIQLALYHSDCLKNFKLSVTEKCKK